MVEINLLPWREEIRCKKLQFALWVSVFGVLAVVFILVVSCVYLSCAIDRVHQEASVVQKENEIIEKQKTEILKINAVNNLLVHIKDKNKSVFLRLKTLFTSIPQVVKLEKFYYMDEGWGFEGQTFDHQKLLSWVKSLEEKKLFRCVDFKKWKVGDDIIDFSFKESC